MSIFSPESFGVWNFHWISIIESCLLTFEETCSNGSFAASNRKTKGLGAWNTMSWLPWQNECWMYIYFISIMETFAFPGCDPTWTSPAYHFWFITHVRGHLCFPLSCCVFPAPCSGLGSSDLLYPSGPTSGLQLPLSALLTWVLLQTTLVTSFLSMGQHLPLFQLLAPTVSGITSTTVN